MQLKTLLSRMDMSLGQRVERISDPKVRTALLEIIVAIRRAMSLV